MKNGKYLVYNTLNIERPDGIEKKILKQCEMFRKSGIDMSILTLQRVKGSFWRGKYEFKSVDFVYFRKSTIIDWKLIDFFRRIKKESPNTIIMMEIPTYPYEGEFGQSIKSKLSLLIDHYFRKRLTGIIDYIVVTGAEVNEYLWGIKTISIVNGIDVANIKPSKRVNDGVVNIGCIAKFSRWHGYERIIQGLANYYSENHEIIVKIIMVGDGVEKPYYEDLVHKLGLDEYVQFTGQLIGEDLDGIYDKIDIGCCSLGRYKSGINVIGDLKSREFMAKGLPMILGCEIDILNGIDYPFALKFNNDNSSIDILRVLEFYNNLLMVYDNDNLKSNIRKYAFELADFNTTFSPVINEIVKD